MMENDDVQELTDDHEVRIQLKSLVADFDVTDHGDQGMRLKAHAHDQDQGQGNKHSYNLRAKAPRFPGFQVGDEDGEFKKPSSVVRVRAPSFQSKTDHHFGECSSMSEEEELANWLVMLSNKPHSICNQENKVKEVVEKGMFQCKACKKVFSSHQALGGHRASHKKVKGCFASKIEDEGENMDMEEAIQEDQESTQLPGPEPDSGRPIRKRAKMHECSVCRRVFSSGQALGGHKRCHWLTTSTDNAFIPNFHDFQYDHLSQKLCKNPLFTKSHEHNHDHHYDHDLDLNLNLPPAPRTDQKYDHNEDDLDEDKTNKHETSTRLCLQQWSDQNQPETGNEMERNGEEGCAAKLRKLSDLRDKNLDGGWLQMGIPSTSEMR